MAYLMGKTNHFMVNEKKKFGHFLRENQVTTLSILACECEDIKRVPVSFIVRSTEWDHHPTVITELSQFISEKYSFDVDTSRVDLKFVRDSNRGSYC